MAENTPVYNAESNAVAATLGTDVTKGLAAARVADLLEQHGKNVTSSGTRVHPLLILLNQLKSPVVYLLVAAAGLSFFFKEYADAVAILVVIAVNTVIGFVMEWQAARSMEALSKMTQQTARVVRDGKVQEITADDIVPGDILLVEAGDMVPADGRLAEATQLQADESALTGESVPVDKNTDTLTGDIPLAERHNMLFKGTFIRKGNARLICTTTGMHTELGAIASMVQTAKKAATPLEKKLESFSKRLMGITLVIVAIIFIAGLLNKVPVQEMLETSIALAVAAIPEGLPIVATLALARGMMLMARRNVIVKKLSAVETLGSVTVICTDKTGTLTENRMDVTAVTLPPGEEIAIQGQPENKSNPAWDSMLKVAVLCNNASVDTSKEEAQKGIGDPLEVSLLEFAAKAGAKAEELRNSYPRVKEMPFDSDVKVMSTLQRTDKGFMVTAKGATENLLEHCTHILQEGNPAPLEEPERKKWLEYTEALAAKGLKPLAFALRETDQEPQQLAEALVLVGLAGFLDPPREDVKQAIAECHNAHIQIMMLTGDHPATALNIAGQLDIGEQEEKVITGKDMPDTESLTAEQKAAWRKASVFARVSPKQKLDLVAVLQENHDIVAMTGDGVNDAPALKKADIGIAMGIRGTQVTQEVADMILKDDAFSSIVDAVKQGRIIFDNIRLFVIFLLSCNLSELLVIGVCAAFHLPFQLFALQILFINLITDVLPALALGVADGNAEVMKKKPKDPRQPLLDKRRWISIWIYSAVIAAASLGAAWVGELQGEATAASNNTFFFTLIFCQLLHVLNMASAKAAFFNNEVFRNKYVWIAMLASLGITLLTLVVPALAKALRVESMTQLDWLLASGFSIGSVLVIRILKKLNLIV